jgi:hypothetical protein
MATPHELGAPHYPEDPDVMEARLIEEITQIQVGTRARSLGPSSTIALRAAYSGGGQHATIKLAELR